jgi:hypothetical protein
LRVAYPGRRTHLGTALQEFRWFWDALRAPPAKIRVWGHGASFDLPILESTFHTCGHPIPWGHCAVRDTLTILELADVKIAAPDEAKHDAFGDARAQALSVINAARILSSHLLWPETRI